MPRLLPLSTVRAIAASALALGLAACGRGEPALAHAAAPAGASAPAAKSAPAYEKAFYTMMATRRPSVPAMAALGKALFFDPAMSASGKLSCASCHSPAHAYGPPNDLSVQLGGPGMDKTGVRAAPSLRYLQNVPPFSEHFFENDGNDSEDQGPTGGYTWDGRVSSTHDQARIPLLSAHEMANGTPASVVAKLRNGSHGPAFRQVFGNDILDDEDTAFRAALMALEVFQQTPSEFYPYDSKYDAFLRRQVKLSPQEMRGLQAFSDPAKGNCASCHVSAIKQDGAFPAFTDFGHIAVGVPRNRKLEANADPAFFDLGLCGPDRTDLKDHADYCGRFRTPSLRNVALRKTFFHNGAIHSLEDAVRFYAQRDTQPQKWYPRKADGTVDKFDDLPPQYHANVNMEPPFGGKPGDKPVLSEADVRDIVAFLKTLTDGYRPPHVARR
ncbi:cytochrome-c peroxidase [Ralstonia mannitolilytica]|uniref:Methylamine utilization protein MauG n=1 Tax=Ralstonia mannitolilytica TaxID=105219 RepID=A0AAD2ELV4_9RALS|nr:cytochrome-c peroxidase [Ralstonia mannitolilytica]MBY4718583.1 cytochrome-c peroxidase [Ralstonia mannitolilytica]CAJ0694355.1 Methylamine utilization protein MauG [Ralstonia mannitolilytica]CAJ0717861.1 Methylamine utilization protein MauG [Ralstonia mannitolilytica]CAJ0889205.1 Methylamine utilization protein MauG [Ralstonia mannitolilytica]